MKATKIIAGVFFLPALFAFSAAATELPSVRILATGGTIAGKAPSSTQTTGYTVGDIGIQTLIDAVPAIKNYADISGEQVANISSNNMDTNTILKLAKRVNALLSDPKINGIVITHGTDTLEETAYFLNLVTKSDKPVVLVGAMRPSTAISADGPMNLLEAVQVAASKEARGKGVMVVMNDVINGARDVTKTNTTNVDTFKSPELGALGYISGNKIRFYKESTKRHTINSEFDISNLEELPRVEIIYAHIDSDRLMADAAVKTGAKGIIHAGTGNGTLSDRRMEGLKEASAKGVVVVRSSRVPNGATTVFLPKWTNAGFIEADSLNPQKARLLLQLALTKTKDLKEIQRMFYQY